MKTSCYLLLLLLACWTCAVSSQQCGTGTPAVSLQTVVPPSFCQGGTGDADRTITSEFVFDAAWVTDVRDLPQDSQMTMIYRGKEYWVDYAWTLFTACNVRIRTPALQSVPDPPTATGKRVFESAQGAVQVTCIKPVDWWPADVPWPPTSEVTLAYKLANVRNPGCPNPPGIYNFTPVAVPAAKAVPSIQLRKVSASLCGPEVSARVPYSTAFVAGAFRNVSALPVLADGSPAAVNCSITQDLQDESLLVKCWAASGEAGLPADLSSIRVSVAAASVAVCSNSTTVTAATEVTLVYAGPTATAILAPPLGVVGCAAAGSLNAEFKLTTTNVARVSFTAVMDGTTPCVAEPVVLTPASSQAPLSIPVKCPGPFTEGQHTINVTAFFTNKCLAPVVASAATGVVQLSATAPAATLTAVSGAPPCKGSKTAVALFDYITAGSIPRGSLRFAATASSAGVSCTVAQGTPVGTPTGGFKSRITVSCSAASPLSEPFSVALQAATTATQDACAGRNATVTASTAIAPACCTTGPSYAVSTTAGAASTCAQHGPPESSSDCTSTRGKRWGAFNKGASSGLLALNVGSGSCSSLAAGPDKEVVVGSYVATCSPDDTALTLNVTSFKGSALTLRVTYSCKQPAGLPGGPPIGCNSWSRPASSAVRRASDSTYDFTWWFRTLPRSTVATGCTCSSLNWAVSATGTYRGVPGTC